MLSSAHYHESAAYLRRRLPDFTPEALIILGSGLGFMADELTDAVFIPYEEIPHFKTSTAPGHKGRLAAGRLAGRNLLVMQGRFHIYEGYTPEEAAFPIRVASLFGIRKLITTCACGGVNTNYRVGELVLINDLINLTHFGPLTGFDASDFNTRFVDMTYVFSREMRTLAHEAAAQLDISLREGVYFYMPGPQFETPAEIKAIRTLGGDLVGMSTMPECTMARRCGMDILGVALVSNMAAGVLDQPITEGEVLVEAQKAASYFSKLITAITERI